MNLTVTILAGGAGTRFWPLSTEDRPKQFLTLQGERSLLQMSYDRVASLVGPERIQVLTNERYVALVREQLPELPSSNVVGEPARRDTAAAVALAALFSEKRFPGATMAVLTADHWISPTQAFHQAMREATERAVDGTLYTFGIRPDHPATGYGYLETDLYDPPHGKVLKFKEKPDLETARRFLEAGNYFWNSGMFVWRQEDILNEFRRHLPRHLELLEPHLEGDWRSKFLELERISIDYAILEKAEKVGVMVPSFDWNDVGGWHTVGELLSEDAQGNRVRGRGLLDQTSNTLTFCEDQEEQVVLVGVKDLVVVRSQNRTLVVNRHHLDSLKGVIARLNDHSTS